MTYNPSRRLFLGGSVAASAAGAAGLITPAGLAAAQPMQSPKIMYVSIQIRCKTLIFESCFEHVRNYELLFS